MNGAELLVKTAIGAGIKVCFANPGTTELPIVMALDKRPGSGRFWDSSRVFAPVRPMVTGRMLDKPR